MTRTATAVHGQNDTNKRSGDDSGFKALVDEYQAFRVCGHCHIRIVPLYLKRRISYFRRRKSSYLIRSLNNIVAIGTIYPFLRVS